MPVHPRSRGEHFLVYAIGHSKSGSSPLARGTQLHNNGENFDNAVHPRSRGEHVASACYRYKRGGSSPLARGTPSCTISRMKFNRFIPARAGNTSVNK